MVELNIYGEVYVTTYASLKRVIESFDDEILYAYRVKTGHEEALISSYSSIPMGWGEEEWKKSSMLRGIMPPVKDTNIEGEVSVIVGEGERLVGFLPNLLKTWGVDVEALLFKEDGTPEYHKLRDILPECYTREEWNALIKEGEDSYYKYDEMRGFYV